MVNLFIILILATFSQPPVLIPIRCENRADITNIHLTEIGQFGLLRKARSSIREHYHTGIDIKRPGKNYTDEPVFPLADGKVISKRTDGPYANLIIEHHIKGAKVWTLYEHIAGIKVSVNDWVKPQIAIARFMNKEELNRFGWQFDHFHLEVLKKRPKEMKPDKIHSERFFCSYTLDCFTIADLRKYYFHPIEFMRDCLKSYGQLR